MLKKLRHFFQSGGDTLPFIDTREVERIGVLPRRLLRVMVRPSLKPIAVGVNDISLKGVGLVSPTAIDPGANLAVLWTFGPPRAWRTLRARVARVTERRNGGWIVGCVFHEPLEPPDMDAFLLAELVRDEW